jgi:aminoglycoside phosphotransferase (APT) family kinase protein
MVMDRAPGAHLLSGLSGAGAITSAMRAPRQIPGLLAVAMANLHKQDPRLVRDRLDCVRDMPVTVSGLLAMLHAAASDYRRPDLTAAAQWLADHPPPAAPEVICHGDLHPFNVLVDGASFTVLDWSAAILAPRAYDVAFTSLLLAEPPLAVPRAMRPAVRGVGGWLASRFAARYQRAAGARVDPRELRWHQGVVCLRALTEAAGWTQDQLAGARAGHPWLLSGPAFASRLTALTGSNVRAR